MELKQKIQSLGSKYFPEVKRIREYLHAHPELSFEEEQTSSYLKEELRKKGIAIDKNWVKTGFTAVIGKADSEDTLLLRADIDALPITEKNNVSYKSKNEGIMHACGHDVHAACLLGAATILKELEDDIPGRIILFFQAGEEKLPGGAKLAIEEGLLKTYQPKIMLAQHVYPEFEVGNVGFREGMYMASTDEIYLTVKGKGGHAALPHKLVDPIVIAANIILQLQQLSSRFAPPDLPTVLSFGRIEGLGATNVIPEEVKLQGTLRTFNEEWRGKFHKRLKQMAEGIAQAAGGQCEVEIKTGYPNLINDPELTQGSKQCAIEYLGENRVHDLDLRMTAEDFAYFSQSGKVCFYRLGVGNQAKGITAGVHNPHFDIDEEALSIGSGLMAYLAISQLKKISQSQ
jgi:amidohydrolase